MTIGLRHLRAFLAAGETGGVGKAAARLRRTQSAISRSIHILERELGVALFERHPAGMAPTEAGRALLARGAAAAAEFRAVADDMKALEVRRVPPAASPVFAMTVDNSRFEAFIAVTEDHHVASAARRLGLTQPAISASIRQLEASLGAKLFERSLQGLRPTPLGEALAVRAKRAFAELRHAAAEISALQGALAGTVAVGALPFGRTIILPRAINRLLDANPGLRVATTEGPFDTLARALRSGDLDFIFGALREPPPADDLVGEPVLRDKLSVFARKAHPLAGETSLRFEQVRKLRWVLPRQGTPARHLFDGLFVRRGLTPPDDVIETSSLAMVRALLMESDRVTALSRHQVHYELAYGMLAELQLDLGETGRPIGFMRRTGSLPSPGAALLMDAIRAVAAAHAQGGR
ncbi:MAG: LysR family transcriptional regulator [Alphaproteobacteria bacterium]